jgi:ribosomal protein S18 acetylase RimI-like enzyme
MVCSNFAMQDAAMNSNRQFRPGLRPHRSIGNAYRTLSRSPGKPRAAGEPMFLDDGSMLLLRPIGESDVDALIRAFKRMTPEQVRARVFHALSELPEPIARFMCRVDPEKTIALVATDPDGSEIRGEARVHLDPVTQTGELAIAIDPGFTGRGLGRILVERLIDASKTRDLDEIWGDTQAGNTAMLALTRRLGFTQRRERDDATLVRFSLDLHPMTAHAVAAKG